MGLELLLATLEKVQTLALICAIICGASGAFALMIFFFEENRRALPPAKWLLIGALVSALPVCTPRVEDVWRIRIGLIKLHLASPDNVEKGVEAIERVARKLECKYVGCEETKQ